MKEEIPNVEGLSESNIRYCKRFYLLYCEAIENLPQVVEKLDNQKLPQVVEELYIVPWGHHRYIIDKCSSCTNKALFFIHQTVENGWSRSMLLNSLTQICMNDRVKASNRSMIEKIRPKGVILSDFIYIFAMSVEFCLTPLI